MSMLEKYGLRSNPFSEERHDFPMVGRRSDWSKILNVMNEVFSSDSCGIITIFGDYGMGKTFTLLEMKKKYDNAQSTTDAGKIIPIFLKTLETSVPSNYLSDLLIRLVRNIGEEKIFQLAKQIRSKEITLTVDQTLQNIFQKLAYDDAAAWKWLAGRSVSSSEMKNLEADYRLTEKYETFSTFMGFLKFLKAAGYDNLVILFDEFEYLLSKGSLDQVRTVVRELQRVWDGYNEATPEERSQMCKVIFVIGSSIGSWRIFLEMVGKDAERKGGGGTETFLRRIPASGKIDLSPLTKSDIQKFLINRLEEYRKKSVSNVLSPLTEDYVKFISEVSWGMPSTILNRSALIFKKAVEKEKQKIDAEFGQLVLKEHGLLREMEEVQN